MITLIRVNIAMWNYRATSCHLHLHFPGYSQAHACIFVALLTLTLPTHKDSLWKARTFPGKRIIFPKRLSAYDTNINIALAQG